jgi:hypothetical protein
MYKFLDYFFTALHGGFVLFTLTGWAWSKTRRVHLIATTLTILSWFGLGIFYGWGYCPSTDWHWEVKRRLGETDLPNSYIKYYLDKLTPFNWDIWPVDAMIMTGGILVFGLSCWFNWRERRAGRR